MTDHEAREAFPEHVADQSCLLQDRRRGQPRDAGDQGQVDRLGDDLEHLRRSSPESRAASPKTPSTVAGPAPRRP
ncbi:hypothetical protein [Streptomyces sp. V3I7]|uniref:hypothetical protein n=1 Tax=Streptomyces sp. V3I7 TaxID=3042278 RepID=UPI0027874EE0|nr:hypothetical protein [Streptomyces sp. V3I7]MDQ0988912.1 hypothetical protein [Streptomyces sp. V3I7]